MILKTAICDDNPKDIEIIDDHIKHYYNDTDIDFSITRFTSPVELLKHCTSEGSFNIIFLDVEMEPYDGIETARKIREIPDKEVKIVFITDHEEYMKYGFEVQASYYLSKTSITSEFKKVMNLVLSSIQSDKALLRIKMFGGSYTLVKLKEIVYIESLPYKRDVVIYHMKNGEVIKGDSSILSIGNELKSKGFVFLNKHALVNIHSISKFSNDHAILTNNLSFPITRSYRKAFNEVFMKKQIIEEKITMEYITSIISSAFDIFTMSIYFSYLFHGRKGHINHISFWSVYILGEIILSLNTFFNAGNYSFVKTCFTVFLAFTVTFSRSFLYKSSGLMNNILISLLYQTIAIISENLAAGVLYLTNPKIFEKPGLSQDLLVSSSAQLIVFLFVIFISTLVKHKERKIALIYITFLIFIPIISIIILYISFYSIVAEIRYERVLPISFSLLAINALCFILFDKTSENSNLAKQLEQSKKQLDFQSSKYAMLSDSYRQTRGIVHDMRKFNRLIRTCISERNYDELLKAVEKNESDLNTNVTLINTGNLVIDAFVSNYIYTAKKEDIDFKYKIDVDKSTVPIENYDLCIILGNLLDNSFEACRRISRLDSKRIVVQIHTNDNFFVIYIANTFNHEEKPIDKYDEFIHGYGTLNVKNIVDKHHGFYYAKAEDVYEATVSLPLKKRF